jgi:lauroyl/myristoyl acyltransferase
MVNVRLWRLAYRDAVDRDIKQWGIIMEPERVERMNKGHGFTFEQLGEVKKDYQGGDCAAFVMNLDEVASQMRRKKPIQYFWFTRKSLRS